MLHIDNPPVTATSTKCIEKNMASRREFIRMRAGLAAGPEFTLRFLIR
jgi:hypothetical protein